MPCPYYMNGYCTSPKLPQPSEHVVTLERCLGDESAFKLCRYYVEKSESTMNTGILSYSNRKEGLPSGTRIYPAIHLIHTKPTSSCTYFKIYEITGGFVAYCDKLKRLLTKSEAQRCSKYSEDCPYRRIV